MWCDVSLWFWFSFPQYFVILSTFSCTCWLLWKNMFSWEKYLFSSSAHFFNWIVCFVSTEFRSSLYNLEINPLSDIWFASIFSHSTGCLFTLFMVLFAIQKLFNVMQSHLFVFDFVSFAFEVKDQSQWVYCLCFLPGIL